MINEIVGYENLHLHTDFSLLDGYGMVEEYAERAKKINQQFLCISDHGVMGSVPRQLKACDENKLNHIFACELYVNPIQPEVKTGDEISTLTKDMNPAERKAFSKSYHLLAIAYNSTGYKNLVKLTSWGFLKGFYRKPRVNHEMLLKHKEGLIFTSCCYNSEIGQAFDRGGEDAGFAMVEKYMAMFGENFYLEIMFLDFKKQKPYDVFICKARDKYNLPVIVTTDCFVAGTLVLTDKGLVPIEDIVVGDNVLTHKNRFKSVEIVGSRKLHDSEKVYRVKTRVGTYAVEATGNHKLYVANRNENSWNYEWKKTESLTKDDFLLVPKIQADVIFGDVRENIDLMDFMDISDYQCGENYNSSNKGNLGCKTQFVETTQEFISYRGWDRKCKINIPRIFPVDDDFLSILGWYIAEGWSEKKSNQVGFALHANEQEVADFIIKYFSKFGIQAKTYKVSENGIAVRFSSVVFNRFFGKLCGLGASNKHLPYCNGTWLKSWSKEQLIKIISKYWQGDGSDGESQLSFGSTSKTLIFELSTVFNSLGMFVYPHLQIHEKWSDRWNIVVAATKSECINGWFNTDKINEFEDPRVKGTKYFDTGTYYAVQINSIDEINYDGLVYDFQVEEDHSFIANLYVSSNCHYCNPEDSHMQRLMLMVQTKKTILDIQKAQEKAAADDSEMEDFFELQDQNLWMKSEQEIMDKWYKDYRDVIDYDIVKAAKQNTVAICQKAKGVQFDRSMKLPVLEDANGKLLDAVQAGFMRRNLPKNKLYLDRIREEYELVCQKEFSSYFLIQKMMTDEARRVCRQILGYGSGAEAVGPARGCLAGNSPILVENGRTKNLSSIEIGDKVYGHDGKLHKVLNKFEYDVNEPMLKIKCFYGDAVGITLTQDHKIYAEVAEQVENYDSWQESTKRARKRWSEPTGNLSWIPASSLKVGDFVFVPQLESTNELQDLTIDLSKYANGSSVTFDSNFVYYNIINPLTKKINKTKKCNRYIYADDLCYLLGRFAGDGWFRKRNDPVIGFAFNSDDVAGIEKVTNLLKSIGFDDITTVRTKTKNSKGIRKKCVQLFAKSKVVRLLFEDLFCDYKSTPQTKHVPNIVMKLNKSQISEYLKGYLDSDGSYRDNSAGFSSISNRLTDETRHLCNIIGLPSSKRYDKRKNKNGESGMYVGIPNDSSLSKDRDCEYVFRKTDGGYLLKIRSIELVTEIKKVYDIQVEDVQNYLTSSFVVHNSGGGSLLLYCLGVTDVNPIEHDLLFSRFLSPARGGKLMKLEFTSEPISIDSEPGQVERVVQIEETPF